MRFGWGVDRVLSGDVAWNLAWMLVSEILRDPYSHVVASVAGWSYVPNPADVQFLNWIDAMAAMNHQPGKVRQPPVRRGWETGMRDAPAAPKVENLQRRSALKDRLGLKY